MSNKFEDYSPMRDNVLVRPLKEEEWEKMDGGMAIPESVLSQKPSQRGLVYRVGNGIFAIETGEFMPTSLSRNDIILFQRGGGIPIDVLNEEGKKEEMRLMREPDVWMVIKKSAD